MNPPTRTGYLLSENILELLSDDEVSKVTTESRAALEHGDEFIDLQQPDQGVLQADGVPLKVANLLARKAVNDHTWQKIVKILVGTARAIKPARSR